MKNLSNFFGVLFFGLALLSLWLTLSASLSTIWLGLLSVLATLFLFHQMFTSVEHYYPRVLHLAAIGYFIWLIKEAILGAMQVCKIILSINTDPEPEFITIKFAGKNSVFRSFLAHSITLTPGTVAVMLKGKDKLIVHSLTKNNTKSLEKGTMQKRLLELESKVD